MHIDHITIENFLGVRFLDEALSAPGVTLIAGHNGAGKSTVRDAIRFAFTGESGRVRLKKDYGALLAAGAKDGHVTLLLDGDREIRRNVKTGNLAGSMPTLPDTLPYVLDADRFARLDTKARRRLLMELAGVSVSRDDVRRRLIDRGCDADKVDAVLPLLRQGFEAASQEAAGRARESKGAWRQVTGENWGKAKAEGWQAPVPEQAEEGLEQLETARKAILEQLDKARADLIARTRLEAAVASDDDQQIGHITALDAALSDAVQAASYWQSQVECFEAMATNGGGLLTWFKCPDCGARHRVLLSRGELQIVPDDVDDPTAQQELEHAREELEKARRAVTDLNLKLEQAHVASDARQALANMEPAAQLDERVQSLEEDLAKLDRQIADAKAADEARKATERAHQLHQEVMAWLAISEALSPDGIPAELTTETIEPINARLLYIAQDTGWPQPVIGPDMEITAGGRPYGLLSESEQWRTDAMLGAAIGLQADLRLLVLDRMDVLDITSRWVCIRWLAHLAKTERMQVIVMATLKARPEKLMPGVTCIWLDQGAAT